MNERLLASLVINNYNYGRFLKEAIDSALSQTWPNTEVIVVDDGSTDHSREIIAAYGDQITAVLKENGGQASALNEGFAISRGEVVCFLDSDDTLLPTALEKAVALFSEGGVVKVHWALWEVDEQGERSGHIIPRGPLSEGDLRHIVKSDNPFYLSPPQSGNAWTRVFLKKVFPLPTQEYRKGGADTHLSMLSPLFGLIKRVTEPQGTYRIHSRSNYAGKPFEERLKVGRAMSDPAFDALGRHCFELGIDVNPEAWKANSWFCCIERGLNDIISLTEPGDAVILVDDDQWGTEAAFAQRRHIPFLEREGKYWGAPPDDNTAIDELERLRIEGAKFIVFAWPSFWWLEHYLQLSRYLRARYRCLLENDRVVIFDLRWA